MRQRSKDHNAKQAQARRERKEKEGGGPSSIHDVFEYVSSQQEGKGTQGAVGKRDSRMARRAQRNDAGDQDEREDRGVGAEASDDDAGDEKRDPTVAFSHTGPSWDIEDGGVRSEDDEEIDSDEAFGESDEEKYEGWKFGAGAKKTGTMDSHAGETDDDDDEDGDMMDISRMLDGDASRTGSESDSEDEEDDVHSGVDSGDERLQRRMESIAATAGTKRAATDDDGGPVKEVKRRVLNERTEAVPEGEWSAPSRSAGASLLTIDDLMAPVRAQGGTAFTSLRDTAKALRHKQADGRQAVASRKGGAALQAPLPSVVQDRLDRSAAYEETKAEVQGWQPTIKRIREAEHLSFPLQPEPVIKPSTSLMTTQFKPSNEFERGVAAMLEREGLSEKRLAEAEELKMNERGMSADEIRARREELRKMRDLLFREEQKAKRVSKIKSKTYRKIARKQRQREQEKANEAGLLVNDNAENEETERENAERLRARERATLKHKNTGKWAKNMIGLHGSNDMPEARNAIEEQLRRGEELRRRIQGQQDEESSGDEDAGNESDEEGAADAFDELRTLERKSEAQRRQDEEDMAGKKGVWGMKFMKDARDRKARETKDDIDNFQTQMEEMERSEGEDGAEDGDGGGEPERYVGSNPGRMAFAAAATSALQRNVDERENDSGKDDVVGGFSDEVSHGGRSKSGQRASPTPASDGSNPWLVGKGMTKLSRKKNESTVSKEGSAQSKAANRIQKHVARGDEERAEAIEDAQLDIDPEARLKLRATQASSAGSKPKKTRSATNGATGDHSDSDEDSLDDEPAAVRGKGPVAMRQRALVAEAFAGDDVAADFAEEKSSIINADAPQTIDTTLPGWGSWGGKGVRVNKKRAEEQKKRFAKVVPGLDPSKRKDAAMTNVIINHKKDKKADKYRGTDVPYPYTSRAQYEMAMRNPLGPEWNTRTQHQKLTLPRVTTKPGKAIKPIGE